MRTAITGSSGFLGGHLVQALRSDGHDIVKLVRRAPAAPDEVRWDPAEGRVDTTALGQVDSVVHLAGAGLGDRPWTPAYRRVVYDSRVQGTRTIARAVANLDHRPATFVSMSGVGYYGNPGDEVVDESYPAGDSYIAKISHDWERATESAAEAGIRVVTSRTGVVVAGKGGAFGRLLPIFRLGLGGRLGSGNQFWSWIGLRDYLRAMRFLLDRADISGPVNVCAPNPVTNGEFTKTLAQLLHRPAVLPVPAQALRLPFGDFALDLLQGQRVVPKRLLDKGFEFLQPTIEDALREVVARQPAATS